MNDKHHRKSYPRPPEMSMHCKSLLLLLLQESVEEFLAARAKLEHAASRLRDAGESPRDNATDGAGS